MKKNDSILSGITFSFFIILFVICITITLLMLFPGGPGFDRRQFGPASIVLFISGVLCVSLLLSIVLKRIIIVHCRKLLNNLLRDIAAISHEHPGPVSAERTADIAEVINRFITRQNNMIQASRRSIEHMARELKVTSSNMLQQLECLQDQYNTAGSENACSFSRVIQPLHYIQGLADDLLFLDALSSRSEKVNKEKCNVYSIVEGIIQNYRKSALAKDIVIENSLSPGFTIHTDKKLITIMMDHLISNAVDFSVTDCNIAINCIITGGKVKLSVTNKVVNLDNDDVMFLFDPFWQKEKPGDPVREHSGLGLAIVRAAAQLLETDINAEFINNKYLMVTIEWPLV